MFFFSSGGALPINCIHEATTLLLRPRKRSRRVWASRADVSRGEFAFELGDVRVDGCLIGERVETCL